MIGWHCWQLEWWTTGLQNVRFVACSINKHNVNVLIFLVLTIFYFCVGLLFLPPPPRWLIGFKVSISRAARPVFGSHFRQWILWQDFSGSSHTSDLKIGTPAATLPDTWHYRVSTRTGQPSVSILWPGEVESLICNFFLSVAAHRLVWADLSLRYTSMLLGC